MVEGRGKVDNEENNHKITTKKPMRKIATTKNNIILSHNHVQLQ